MSGVIKKIVGRQISANAVSKNSYSSWIFYVRGKPGKACPNVHFHKISTFSMPREFQKYIAVNKAVSLMDKLASDDNVDALIFRYYPPTIKFLRFMNLHSRGCHKYKFFTEHNTKELVEHRIRGNWHVLMLELLFGKYCISRTDGIIGVSSEIVNYEKKKIGVRKKSMVMTNGVVVNEFKLCNKKIDKNKLNLIMVVGDFHPWHGIDRVLKGLETYSGTTDVSLSIVGPIKRGMLDVNSKILDKVRFTGPLYGAELDAEFQRADVAVATLALHRKHMKSTSALKTAEYLARGMPIVMAYKDDTIRDNLPFIHLEKPNDTPLDITQIISFASRTQGVVMRKKIREYAEKNVEWRQRIIELSSFIVRTE